MHARVIRGWRGSKTAILLIVGFVAILLTFFGNYVFSGLHSY
jgi:ABC-type transport system involved in cytochrome c biogenesis permease subunit